MKYGLDPEIIEVLQTGTHGDRHYLCSKDPLYFGIYYFPEFYTYAIPPYQYDFYEDGRLLIEGDLSYAAWIAFRESIKTTCAKIFVLWAICYNKKHYINWDSYDKGNAEAALFDIVVQLQTNGRLIEDFGNLYNKKSMKEALSEATMKRIGSFITENGIKVEAFSTQESARGRVYKQYRPDFFIFDDVETSKTVDSAPVTAKIIRHIDEVKAGLSVNACVLILGNYLSDSGVIAHVVGSLQNNPRAVTRSVPVYDKLGKIAWPDKYVATDEECAKINATMDNREEYKVSLEAKRRDLGEKVFQTEMLNDPGSSGDYVFDRRTIIKLMEKCEAPLETVGGVRMWTKYNPSHSYGGGADTAEGIGADSNTAAVIDFTQKPNTLVATFADNQISPTQHAHVIKRIGNMFGRCIFIPEINNTGYATVAELRNIEYYNMYMREVKNKTTGQLIKEFGWRATEGTVHEVVSQFKEAVESGALVILDQRMLEEMYHMRKSDVRILKKSPDMTRHFDLVRAGALAWEARTHTIVPETERKVRFKSPQKEVWKP